MGEFLSFIARPEFLLGLLLLNFVLLLLIIILAVRMSRVRKSLKRLFTGVNGGNLETGLHQLMDELEGAKKRHADQQFQINRLTQKLSSQCGNVAIMRFNAFGDIGSDLSFSLAIVDEAQNGVVITSIYGREESRIYAKPLEGGKSLYNLSEEEQAVIKKASSQNS